MGGARVTTTDKHLMLTLKRGGLTIQDIATKMNRSRPFIRTHMPIDSDDIAPDVQAEPIPQPTEQPEQDAVPDILTMIRDLVNYCEKLQADNTQHMLAIDKLERDSRIKQERYEATNRHWLDLVESAKARTDTHDSLMARAGRLMQPSE